MRELIDYKDKVCGLCERGTAVIENAGMLNEADEFRRTTDEILSKTSPSLMFYGIYNSGKSSIINAIFGKDIAAVGDIPTTCETQTLEWNHFKIVDTPGINAKNEHTLVAQSEINKSDVVLFVIDDMNIEEVSFYNALIDVLKKSISVIIVINQKEADYSLKDSDKIHLLNRRIMELVGIASRKAGISGIEKNNFFHGVIPVNAVTARYSQGMDDEDDARLLYDESNMEELIRRMQDILNGSKGVRMLLPAINYAEQVLSSASEKVTGEIKDSMEKNYHSTLNNIKRQRDNLYNRLITEGRAAIGRYKNYLIASVDSNSAPDVSELNVELSDILQRGFASANLDLQKQFDVYHVNIGSLPVEKKDFKLNIPTADNDKSGFDFWEELLSVPKMPDFRVYSNVVAPVPHIPIPEIVGVISMLFKSKKKSEEEKRRREQEMQSECARLNSEVTQQLNERITQIMEFNRRISSEMSKLEESYTAVVSTNIDIAYSPLLEKIESQFSEAQHSADNTKKLLLEINCILNELAKVKSAIS